MVWFFMRLLQADSSRIEGKILLGGRDLLALPEEKMRNVRGNDVAMIFQEPMTSLNPLFTIGDQISEALLCHKPMSKAEARASCHGGASGDAVDDEPPALSEWKNAEVPEPAAAVAVRSPKAALPPALTIAPMDQPEEPKKVPRFSADRPLPTDVIGELELADEADVAMVLRTLAKAGNVNLLVSPDVAGNVSFSFKNIPWDQAFRSVILSAGRAA